MKKIYYVILLNLLIACGNQVNTIHTSEILGKYQSNVDSEDWLIINEDGTYVHEFIDLDSKKKITLKGGWKAEGKSPLSITFESFVFSDRQKEGSRYWITSLEKVGRRIVFCFNDPDSNECFEKQAQ